MSSSSDIHIQATANDPAVQAQAAIHHIHEQLQRKLATAAGQSGGSEGGTGPDRPEGAEGGRGPWSSSDLIAFCRDELRRHLAATDEALYAPATGAAETRLLIRALRSTAGALEQRIDALPTGADANEPGAVAAVVRGIEAILAAHLAVERKVLLPALATLPGVDISLLTDDLQTLLQGGRLEQPPVIDVRDIPHGRRHPRIFARYARLAAGEAFELVNNHDPKPLRREFEAAHPGAFSWDYVESGPEQWRVRIGRVGADA